MHKQVKSVLSFIKKIGKSDLRLTAEQQAQLLVFHLQSMNQKKRKPAQDLNKLHKRMVDTGMTPQGFGG